MSSDELFKDRGLVVRDRRHATNHFRRTTDLQPQTTSSQIARLRLASASIGPGAWPIGQIMPKLAPMPR
jgi:hypothetical protein